MQRRVEFELRLLAQKLFAESALLPNRFGNVDSRAGRAFLAAILECRANRTVDSVFHVGGRVQKVEVLAARLANKPREAVVLIDVFANFPPEPAECWYAAGKVERSQVRRRDDGIAEIETW